MSPRALPMSAVAAVMLLAAACAAPVRHADDAVTLRWAPGQPRAGGPPLAGYRIYYWSASDGRLTAVDVPDPEARRYTLRALAPDEYFFAVVAYDARDVPSEPSNVRRAIVR